MIEAGEGEEVIEGGRETFRAANGIVEALSCDRRCEDEGHIDVEQDGLVFEYLC